MIDVPLHLIQLLKSITKLHQYSIKALCLGRFTEVSFWLGKSSSSYESYYLYHTLFLLHFWYWMLHPKYFYLRRLCFHTYSLYQTLRKSLKSLVYTVHQCCDICVSVSILGFLYFSEQSTRSPLLLMSCWERFRYLEYFPHCQIVFQGRKSHIPIHIIKTTNISNLVLMIRYLLFHKKCFFFKKENKNQNNSFDENNHLCKISFSNDIWFPSFVNTKFWCCL